MTTPRTDDMALLIARLARSLRKQDPGNTLAQQAVRYLQSNSLLSPLRDGDEPDEDIQSLLAQNEGLIVTNIQLERDLAAAQEANNALAVKLDQLDKGWAVQHAFQRDAKELAQSQLAARDAELAAERERREKVREECGIWKQRAEAAERKAEESARDAARYRFIRDDDNWQDDAPDTATWDNLGELSMAEFDAAVDKKMSAAYWEKNPIQAAIAAKGEA